MVDGHRTNWTYKYNGMLRAMAPKTRLAHAHAYSVSADITCRKLSQKDIRKTSEYARLQPFAC